MLTIRLEWLLKDLLCVGLFEVGFGIELHQFAPYLAALQNVDEVSFLTLLEEHAASDLLDVLEMLLHRL